MFVKLSTQGNKQRQMIIEHANSEFNHWVAVWAHLHTDNLWKLSTVKLRVFTKPVLEINASRLPLTEHYHWNPFNMPSHL